MPLLVPQIILALAIAVTLATGIWLLINSRAVAALFRRTGLVQPGPGPRTASRGTVIAMIVAFNLGWIASVAIWSLSMSQEAGRVVETGA